MTYWILKTEPSTYSFDQLLKDKGTVWDGVRNFQARNNLKSMKRGDLCLIYHSVGPKEIVGIAEVTRTYYPDPTAPNDQWVAVDLAPVKKLARPVTLATLKAHVLLSGISLVRQGRLSVCPISKKEFDVIISLSDGEK